MKKASFAELELAKSLIEREGYSCADPALAAVHIYERILSHLSPLVGTAGVHALFGRSAEVSELEHPSLLGLTTSDGLALKSAHPAERLRACLQTQEPAAAVLCTATLFGNFFSLLASLIGERLTGQVLKGAWPGLSVSNPAERKT